MALRLDVSRLLETTGAEERFAGETTLPPTAVGPQSVDLVEPVNVDVTLRSVSEGIMVTGQVEAKMKLTCARCLDEFVLPVSLKIQELYAVAPPPEQEEMLRVEAGHIDLEPVLYENLLLEVPMRPLCRPDCAGLCPVCGANRNREDCGHEAKAAGDVRMQVLKDYFKKRA